MSNTPVDRNNDAIINKLLSRAKAAFDELVDAKVEYQWMVKAYKETVKDDLTEKFRKKFGKERGFLKIISSTYTDLNGIYEFNFDDRSIVYFSCDYFENKLDFLRDTTPWIRLKPVTIRKGIRNKYEEEKSISLGFLLSAAINCETPKFKYRVSGNKDTA